jgi:transcriptional regulator with XRE-family HTH domain
VGDISRAFGLAVALNRRRRHWRQADLARTAGLTAAYISRVELGIVNPGLEAQQKIATALGLSLAELMAQAEEEEQRRRKRLGLSEAEDSPEQP